MDAGLFAVIDVEGFASAAGAIQSDILLAALFFVGTAVLVVLCVPGMLVPAAVASGALLGPWAATGAVALGALAGSQLLFIVARYFARDRIRRRLGERLESFQNRIAAHGLWYVIGLRLIGAPHFLVTAGSALIPMRSTSFAVATFVGLLPVISLAATAGSTI